LLADCVAKVSEQMLWNWNFKNNRIGARALLNQCFLIVLHFESMFRAGMVKILLQQYRQVTA
jgi:hypothetical protein